MSIGCGTDGWRAGGVQQHIRRSPERYWWFCRSKGAGGCSLLPKCNGVRYGGIAKGG